MGGDLLYSSCPFALRMCGMYYKYTVYIYGKCLVSGEHVYITTTYPRFFGILSEARDMEATIHVPEDFEEAEDCFLGKPEF